MQMMRLREMRRMELSREMKMLAGVTGARPISVGPSSMEVMERR